MRRRYVYRQDPDTGEVYSVEVGEEWVPDLGERQPVFTDRYMEGVAATDGTDISSRRKRAEYMRRNNLADADDFKESWSRAQQERAAFYRGERRDPALRHAIGKIEYELSKRRRR